jgi:hypothetical protein
VAPTCSVTPQVNQPRRRVAARFAGWGNWGSLRKCLGRRPRGGLPSADLVMLHTGGAAPITPEVSPVTTDVLIGNASSRPLTVAVPMGRVAAPANRRPRAHHHVDHWAVREVVLQPPVPAQ